MKKKKSAACNLVWDDTWQKEITGNAVLFHIRQSLWHLIMSSQEGGELCL